MYHLIYITDMTKPNARQQILVHLQAHPGATAAELARALGVSAANVRRHLSILLSDGRARVIGERQGQAGQMRGRPVQLYGTGEALTADNLPGLADAALSAWLDALPDAQRAAALQALAARLVPAMPAGGSLPRRLAQAIEQLNRLHYRAHWEAHAGGPRLIFESCPYAAIIGQHPELCRMDRFLLQGLLGMDVSQTARLELNARGLPFCMFVG